MGRIPNPTENRIHGSASLHQGRSSIQRLHVGTRKDQKLTQTGVELLFLIFSSNNAKYVYHFPWWDDFRPILTRDVLDPLGIDVDYIYRLQFANMTRGSQIKAH